MPMISGDDGKGAMTVTNGLYTIQIEMTDGGHGRANGVIVLLGEKRNLSREDAYTLCSLAADLRVTQTVNGSKGIHCMIAKAVVHG